MSNSVRIYLLYYLFFEKVKSEIKKFFPGLPGDDWLPSGARRFPSAYFYAEAPLDNSIAEPAIARLPRCADAKAARAPCRCRLEVESFTIDISDQS